MSFSSLFHAARLSIHVPPPTLGPPPAEPTPESAQRWVTDLLASSSRRQAFYGAVEVACLPVEAGVC
jgi:hypothetical protein